MTKAPAQLDREIAASLGKRDAPAVEGDHYYVVDRSGHRTIYGPYATRKDAAFAGYFHKSVTERDSTPAVDMLFARGVQQYDDDEIKSLIRYPEEYELKSAKIVRRAPPLHSSWKKLGDDEFRQYLRNNDWDRAGRMGRWAR